MIVILYQQTLNHYQFSLLFSKLRRTDFLPVFDTKITLNRGIVNS